MLNPMVEAAGKTFGLADCKQHTTEKDCWLIISGKVYNVTEFLDEHPGGFDIIISATGKGALVLHAVLAAAVRSMAALAIRSLSLPRLHYDCSAGRTGRLHSTCLPRMPMCRLENTISE